MIPGPSRLPAFFWTRSFTVVLNLTCHFLLPVGKEQFPQVLGAANCGRNRVKRCIFREFFVGLDWLLSALISQLEDSLVKKQGEVMVYDTSADRD